MRRKKRGASLVSVVIVSGIVITVGTAMLSLTVSDYRARMNESTRVKNLYSSESGLDAAQDILEKTFDTAIQYSVNKVKDYKKSDDFTVKVAENLKTDFLKLQKDKDAIINSNDLNKKNELIDINKQIDEKKEKIEAEEDKAIDSYFKMQFNDFVYMDYVPDDPEAIKKINQLANRDELRKCIIGKKYISNVDDENNRYSQVKLNNNNDEIKLAVDGDKEGDNLGIQSFDIKADPNYKYDTRKYIVKITSKYFTADKNGTNERKLQATYNMIVPQYKDVTFSESNVKLASYPFLKDKALIIGGNMNVQDANLLANGNIFVQGKGELTNDVSSRVYDKYNGGIILDSVSDKDVEFNGEVVTGKTFNIRNNMNATINGSLYAMNVYAGNEKESDSMTSYSSLDVKTTDNNGEVVVDNDITLKANNTKISIDKFYGLNDKNIKYDKDKTVNESTETLGRTSSSIIVNGNENSDLIIKEQAYIMGVAHLNTNSPEGYSTGESTGVKGNYIAYAYPDPDSAIGSNEKFNYYDPLQLLDDDNVMNKSKHFVDYWNSKLGSVDTGGIQLPEGTININGDVLPRTFSIGAIVYKNSNNETKVLNSNYSLTGIPDVVRNKQRDFASKVYNLSEKQVNDMQALYESLGTSKDQVSDIMAIDNTLADYKEKNKIFFKANEQIDEHPNEESDNEKAIFSDKNITIQSSDANGIIEDGNESIIINVANGDKLNAFIATTGKVTIKGDVDFEGSIVAEGDLDINGVEKKTIKYNKDLIDRIVAENGDVFNSVFGHMRQDVVSLEQTSEANIDVDYDRDKFVKENTWKIIK